MHGFTMLPSYYEALRPLEDDMRLRLFDAILDYAFTGKEPEDLSVIERSLFSLLRPNLDSSIQHYDAAVENGKKGGRPRKKPQAEPDETQQKPRENPEITQQKPNENREKETDKDKKKDMDMDVDMDVVKTQPASRTGTAGHEKNNVDNIVKKYLDDISLSDTARKELRGFIHILGEDCCLRALDTAIDQGVRNWAYVRTILRQKQEQGVRSLADWDRVEQQRKTPVMPAASPPYPSYETQEYVPGPSELQAIQNLRKLRDSLAEGA